MRILLVDGDKEGRTFLADYLSLLGHQVVEKSSGDEGLAAYQAGEYQMVLSDLKISGISGIELVKAIQLVNREQRADVVLYTGFVDVALAVGALRAGAYDYLMKPVNVQELQAALNRVEEHQGLLYENKMLTRHFDEKVQEATAETRRQLKQLQKIMAQQLGIGKVVAFSQEMRQVVDQAQQYHMDRSFPILLQGETGAGKEIVAKIIHYGWMEEPGPFVPLNCATIMPSLLESELFGYEAGAFAGGEVRGSKGKIDLAQGGTLFLDGIREMPLALQAKLLRVVEEKSFYRVGGLKKITTDIRIVCATSSDIKQRIADNLFRKDLYYRLKVGEITIPPLRERQDDILPMALLFLLEFSEKHGKKFSTIHPMAAQYLLDYAWPGNARELRNAMEWAAIMYDEEKLMFEHLGKIRTTPLVKEPPAEILAKKEVVAERFSLDYHIDDLIEEALKKHGGNKTQTAQYLGISVRTLYYRLDRIKKRAINPE